MITKIHNQITGRVLYDKKKELSKTTIASKARTIDNSNISINYNSNNFNPIVNKHEGRNIRYQSVNMSG